MNLMDTMLSMYANPKTVIKNAVHAILHIIPFKANATLKTASFNF